MRVIAFIGILVLVTWMMSSCSSQPPSVTVNGQQLTPIKLDKEGRFTISSDRVNSWDMLAGELTDLGYVWPKDEVEIDVEVSWTGNAKLSNVSIIMEVASDSDIYCALYPTEASYGMDMELESSFTLTFGELVKQWQILGGFEHCALYQTLAEMERKCTDYSTLKEMKVFAHDSAGGIRWNMPELLEGYLLFLKPPTEDYVFLILLFGKQDVKDALWLN